MTTNMQYQQQNLLSCSKLLKSTSKQAPRTINFFTISKSVKTVKKIIEISKAHSKLNLKYISTWKYFFEVNLCGVGFSTPKQFTKENKYDRPKLTVIGHICF